ncbi:MAG: hypothetical protein F4201_07940 [Nitrospira sp. SB0677_bin_15]|nr:hypothetical protein [Nitrospira sp. SB0677_bin_15]
MSAITWKGNHLIQHAGEHDEELGYVKCDENSGKCFLWLKDTCGVLGLNGGYIRGDEFPSTAAAKEKAASSSSAWILHYIWMRNVVKRETIRALDDHWAEISTNLPHDASKDDLREKILRYLEQLPIDEIKAWAEKIKDVYKIVSTIIELAKSVMGG